MSQALVPVPSTEARDYARLLVLIEIRKQRISAIEAERTKLELALTRFAVELKARVGHLRTDLNKVKLQLAEYRRRIERLKENDLLDPEQVAEEVAQEFLERGETEVPPDFGSSSHRIERVRNRTRLDAETEAEILRLYRELAKRFHPDLARSDRQRKRRTELMLQINVAFSERDLLTLQTIAREAEAGDPISSILSDLERVRWAEKVIARLDDQIQQAEGQLDLLRSSETYRLWQSPETAAQSLIDLENKVRQRLTRERDRLDEAMIDYARIVRRRRLPRAMSAAAGE